MDFGLAAAGTISDYFVHKLPHLRAQLGPVAAPSPRLASRIVNTLRAGRAQREFSGLQDVSPILICAPGGQLAQLIPCLLGAHIDWRGKALVLCDCGAFSRDLDALRSAGASVSSFHLVPGSDGIYVVEGDRLALRDAKNIIREVRGSPVEIRAEGADLYCAALTISSSLVTPLLEGCSQALQGAGAEGRQSARISEAMFRHTLRMYMYSGRRSWSGPIAHSDVERIVRETHSLEALDSAVANLYRSGSEAAEVLLRGAKRKTEKA